MNTDTFEQMLTGGHPNSLGRTLEVVELILIDPKNLAELYNCYFSNDEVVRLRTSSALKRVAKEHPDWLIPYIDRLQNEVALIDQASTQWTLATLFETLRHLLSPEQEARARHIMQENLINHQDWIVLNNSMQVLFDWSTDDPKLQNWLRPQLDRLSQDSRKSVSKRASKYLQLLA